MYCVIAPVAAVSAGALTFLVLPINEIVLYCIAYIKQNQLTLLA